MGNEGRSVLFTSFSKSIWRVDRAARWLSAKQFMLERARGVRLPYAPQLLNELLSYGVIGNTTVSGTVILGSNPSRAAA